MKRIALLFALVACRGAPTVSDAGADPVADAGADAGAGADADAGAELSIAKLALKDARFGVFDATLADGRAMHAELAFDEAPDRIRRIAAFDAIAAAMHARTVAPAIHGRVTTGTLGAALATDSLAIVRAHAAIENDGKVEALLFEEATGRAVPLHDSQEPETWARWAASEGPRAPSEASIARDYVEMVALDYMTANLARRSVTVDGDRLRLSDQAGAFPPRLEPRALDGLLRILRVARRFPRGLREGLAALDREHARRILTPGEFEDWLVAPRTVIEVLERRATLLSLIEARILERGEDDVLMN